MTKHLTMLSVLVLGSAPNAGRASAHPFGDVTSCCRVYRASNRMVDEGFQRRRVCVPLKARGPMARDGSANTIVAVPDGITRNIRPGVQIGREAEIASGKEVTPKCAS